MKIIFTPKAVVEAVWNKLQPQQRYMSEIPRSVRLPLEDALLVSDESGFVFGRVDVSLDNFHFGDLKKNLDEGKFQKLELKPVEELKTLPGTDEYGRHQALIDPAITSLKIGDVLEIGDDLIARKK